MLYPVELGVQQVRLYRLAKQSIFTYLLTSRKVLWFLP